MLRYDRIQVCASSCPLHFQRTWSPTALSRILYLLELPLRVLKSSHGLWSVMICVEGICQHAGPIVWWQLWQASLSLGKTVIRDWELRGENCSLFVVTDLDLGGRACHGKTWFLVLALLYYPGQVLGLEFGFLFINEIMLISSSFKSCYLSLACQFL